MVDITGKPFSYPTLRIALEVLGAEIDLPYDVPGGMASFRKTLALSFLFKFWNAVSVDLAIPLEDHSGLSVSGMRTPDDVVGSIHRAASRGQRDNSVRLLLLVMQLIYPLWFRIHTLKKPSANKNPISPA